MYDVPTRMSTSADYYAIRHQLPKVELHAHLNGCIPLDLLHSLASERGVTLSSQHFETSASVEDTTDDVPDMYNVRPRSLQDCFDMFAELPRVINDLVALQRITEAALKEFANHHTVYLELRSTPKRLRHDFREEAFCSKREYVESVIQVMQRFEQLEQERFQRESQGEPSSEQVLYLPSTCRLLLSVDRSQSIKEASETIDLAIAMRQVSEYVVGVDLGGNPTRGDFRDFLPLFQKARDAGCRVTIHCGEIECDDPESATYAEAKAMLEFQPDRIGHGVLLPPDLLDLLEQRKIPVETCPTSNVMTLELHHHHHSSELSKELHGNLIGGLQRHTGLTHWFQTQHPMAICTDDPGVFDTNPTQELWLLRKAFSHLSMSDLCSIVLRSLDFAFCSEDVKEHVRRQIQDRISLIPCAS